MQISLQLDDFFKILISRQKLKLNSFSTIFPLFKKLNVVGRSQSCWNLNASSKKGGTGGSPSKSRSFHLLRSHSLENLHDFVIKKLRSSVGSFSSVSSIPEELSPKEVKARDLGLKWKARARKTSLRR